MQYVKLDKRATDLGYAKLGDAGLDLSVLDFICLAPFGDPDNRYKKLLHTGISVKIPEGHFGLIVPRSSMGKQGISLANTCGIIDSGYTGEIMLFVQNNNPRPINIESNTRIAQLIIVPFLHLSSIVAVDKLPETERGQGGFGSSGV